MALFFTPDEIKAGERLFASPAVFIKSVPALEHLPPADRPEIAFAGRSNVGKSSLINAIARHSGLARASNTPGRTQELNFFSPADRRSYLVDMPGYGYAEAPIDKVEAWNKLIRDYLRGRPTLARVFLLVDARHGLKATDQPMMALLDEAAVSYQVVLTKADKMHGKAIQVIDQLVKNELKKHPAALPATIVTSSETGLGIDGLRGVIAGIVADHAPRGAY